MERFVYEHATSCQEAQVRGEREPVDVEERQDVHQPVFGREPPKLLKRTSWRRGCRACGQPPWPGPSCLSCKASSMKHHERWMARSRSGWERSRRRCRSISRLIPAIQAAASRSQAADLDQRPPPGRRCPGGSNAAHLESVAGSRVKKQHPPPAFPGEPQQTAASPVSRWPRGPLARLPIHVAARHSTLLSRQDLHK